MWIEKIMNYFVIDVKSLIESVIKAKENTKPLQYELNHITR